MYYQRTVYGILGFMEWTVDWKQLCQHPALLWVSFYGPASTAAHGAGSSRGLVFFWLDVRLCEQKNMKNYNIN